MKPHLLPVSIPNGAPPYSRMIKAAPDTASSLAASAAMLIGSELDLGAAVSRILMPPEEEKKKDEGSPLIPRTSSYTEAATSNSYQHQKRRRRAASDNSLLTLEGGGGCRSLRQDAGRDATDTYLVTRIGFQLLRYIG